MRLQSRASKVRCESTQAWSRLYCKHAYRCLSDSLYSFMYKACMSHGGRSPFMTTPVKSLDRSTLDRTKNILAACTAKHTADACTPSAGGCTWAYRAADVQS